MIENKHHHYDRLETFLSKKFSASPDNSSYTYGGVGDIMDGEPDISWRSIVYVKETGWICTHGKIYDASGKSTSFHTPVKINGVDFDGSKDITTKEWGESREIIISDGENNSIPVTVNGGENITLILPEIINTKVVRDSEGRIITETYPTKDELQDEIEKLTTFFVYSGEDDSDPTLDTLPASEWTTQELLEIHAGDYYVTTEGRVFHFEDTPDNGWGWVNITDYYLYNCLDELREVKKKVDISGKWDKIQTSVESDEIYVMGELKTAPYLDVLCCPGYVNYQISGDTPIYLPFAYGGNWTRTVTKYFRVSRLIKAIDLERISGKTIIFTNEKSSLGDIEIILGNTPSGNNQSISVLPGKICILKLISKIKDGRLVFYWEASEVGNTENWITEYWS